MAVWQTMEASTRKYQELMDQLNTFLEDNQVPISLSISLAVSLSFRLSDCLTGCLTTVASASPTLPPLLDHDASSHQRINQVDNSLRVEARKYFRTRHQAGNLVDWRELLHEMSA